MQHFVGSNKSGMPICQSPLHFREAPERARIYTVDWYSLGYRGDEDRDSKVGGKALATACYNAFNIIVGDESDFGENHGQILLSDLGMLIFVRLHHLSREIKGTFPISTRLHTAQPRSTACVGKCRSGDQRTEGGNNTNRTTLPYRDPRRA